MVSSRSEATRRRVLEAARRLLEERGYHGVGLDKIASEAGVSRQAVYLHFRSKSGLLVSLVGLVDQREGLAQLLKPIFSAPNGIAALEKAIAVVAAYEPRIHRLAMVLATARRTDAAAEAAWQDRMNARRVAIRHVLERVRRDGMLAPGWNLDDAVDLIWAVTAPEVFDALVVERNWPSRRWVRHTRRLIFGSLVQQQLASRPGVPPHSHGDGA